MTYSFKQKILRDKYQQNLGTLKELNDSNEAFKEN